MSHQKIKLNQSSAHYYAFVEIFNLLYLSFLITFYTLYLKIGEIIVH